MASGFAFMVISLFNIIIFKAMKKFKLRVETASGIRFEKYFNSLKSMNQYACRNEGPGSSMTGYMQIGNVYERFTCIGNHCINLTSLKNLVKLLEG